MHQVTQLSDRSRACQPKRTRVWGAAADRSVRAALQVPRGAPFEIDYERIARQVCRPADLPNDAACRIMLGDGGGGAAMGGRQSQVLRGRGSGNPLDPPADVGVHLNLQPQRKLHLIREARLQLHGQLEQLVRSSQFAAKYTYPPQ